MNFISYRKYILGAIILLAVASVYFASKLRPSFEFDQFFPKDDPALSFYYEFKDEFESDDNFLLIALENKPSIYDSSFLRKVKAYSQAVQNSKHVTSAISPVTFEYPVVPRFGLPVMVPAIHLDDPSRFGQDSSRLANDPRFVDNLITKKGDALVIAVKNVNDISIQDSWTFMEELDSLNTAFDFQDKVHMLGRPYFQYAIPKQNIMEFAISTVIAGFLVVLILWLLYRRFWGVFIAISSVTLGLVIFMGILGIWGRSLNSLSMLYPVLMLIVGTSDVIHIFSKYVDELKKGKSKEEAINITMRQIGAAILLTSLTTAIGFGTLMTSKIPPVREFGLNSAIAVVTAYVVVLTYTTALLSYFDVDKIVKLGKQESRWDRLMLWFNGVSYKKSKWVLMGLIALIGLSLWSISTVTTNYQISTVLPRGSKLRSDFFYFEKNFSGFRPFEVGIIKKDGSTIDNYSSLKQVNELETFLDSISEIKSLMSYNTVYKSLNQASKGNNPAYFSFPRSEKEFKRYNKLIDKLPSEQTALFLSKNKDMMRISGRMNDIGADKVGVITDKIDEWVRNNIDTTQLSVQQTGTGLMIDRNSVYVRDGLLKGLGLAILIVAILMAILFKNLKLVIISLIPNIFPLLCCGAIMGLFNIELDAGIAIVFAIIFGIAVDDTIHFLSKFKLFSGQGQSRETALRNTFLETGKAVTLTTIILFFGFLVLLFSKNDAIIITGALISITLVTALISDLLLIPVLIRYMLPKK